MKSVAEFAGFGDGQSGGEAAAGEGFAGVVFGEEGDVMVFAEVAEEEGFDLSGEVGGDVFAGGGVGEVAFAAEDALFDGPRDGADLEHGGVVVGFEEDGLAAAEVPFDGVGHVAEVGDDGEAGGAGGDGIADGVDGVVGDGEGLDVEGAELEAGACLEAAEVGVEFAPFDLGGGGVGEEDGELAAAGGVAADEGGEAEDVVGVFVGDEDGVELVGVLADGGEAFEGLFPAEPGIDEDAGLGGGDEDAVARAGAGEHAKAKNGSLLTIPW